MHVGRGCVFQKLDYQWYHTGTIEAEVFVSALSWNVNGKLMSFSKENFSSSSINLVGLILFIVLQFLTTNWKKIDRIKSLH